MGLQAYLTLAALVFGIGLFGVVTRRNTIGILLGIELMMNAVNINLVAFARFSGSDVGMIFTVFAICITVAEAAMVAVPWRHRRVPDVDLRAARRKTYLLGTQVRRSALPPSARREGTGVGSAWNPRVRAGALRRGAQHRDRTG